MPFSVPQIKTKTEIKTETEPDDWIFPKTLNQELDQAWDLDWAYNFMPSTFFQINFKSHCLVELDTQSSNPPPNHHHMNQDKGLNNKK